MWIIAAGTFGGVVIGLLSSARAAKGQGREGETIRKIREPCETGGLSNHSP